MSSSNKVKDKYKITRGQLMKDMICLYRYILIDTKPIIGSEFLSAIPLAARIILDTKYYIKDYGEVPLQVEVGSEGKFNLYCTILLRNVNNGVHDHEYYLNKDMPMTIPIPMPPYECITLKSCATINDLKLEVERNFMEIYWGLKSFVVESNGNLMNAKGNEMVFGMIEVGGKLVLEGWNGGDIGINMVEQICERDPNKGIVECICGTKEDDGERMVSCDICEIWQHTRCVRIPNDEEVPHIFLCKWCEQEIVLFPSLP
ncbi:PHD finger protein PERSISTENT TAPETAL CELL 1-like [Trifolium pratense]|uniref:PHD finger protein PERSISTENT TAPETAL CELL 1-like n=1 Tax=Trifolium pratense TaxID=57577 RepID=UPI001E697CFA|nr:PHD finger protein PERSISTENT TAPETAL CELL 1-like [Trifolium pratense]